MSGPELRLWLLAAALVLDALVGDPDWLWRRVPHPVVVFGLLIGWLDRRLNRETDRPERRRAMGIVATAILVLASAGAGFLLEWLLLLIPYGEIGIVVVAAVFLAQNSLVRHVARVGRALDEMGLEAGRQAVSAIVGRDPERLDRAGVARAAIESGAENFSDGVVAPALWFGLLGLPGLLAYKAVNTADSMIGHRTARHEAFGWAAARLDDFVNLPASRLSAVLISLAAPLAGGRPGPSFVTAFFDARHHRSPNAGWPEAAMAGALGVALAGERWYGGQRVVEPFLNAQGRTDAGPRDIARAVRVLWGAWALLGAAAIGVALALR